MSGPNGGIWRSEDTGKTWQLMLAGQATDVVLDPDSGTVLNPDTNTDVQGNLQVVYAAIRGVGVFMSPNQGQVWNQMLGGIGNPLIFDTRYAPTPTSTRSTARPPTAPRGGSSWPCPPRPATPPRTPSTKAGSMRRRHPRRRLRRDLRHQGLRPELDPGPHPHRAQPGLPDQPGHPHQRRRPGGLSHHRVRPVPAGQLQHRHGRRPDRSQHHLPGRHRRRQRDRTDPHRPDRHLGCPLPGRLLRLSPTTAAH